jgi:hypothetical protein
LVGFPTREVVPRKRSIDSLIDLREIQLGRNHHCLHSLSDSDDHSGNQRLLARISQPSPDGERRIKDLNFFCCDGRSLLRAVQRAKFNICDVADRDLRRLLPHLSPATLSRQLRRLRVRGRIERAANTHIPIATDSPAPAD